MTDANRISRRAALGYGSAAAVALAQLTWPDFVFPDQEKNEELVPFLDVPRTNRNMLDWETLEEWITPQDQVFDVSHYGEPKFDPADFKLEITGLVDKPRTLTMADLQKLPPRDQLMTLECSGNGAGKGFNGAIYNSKWTGTPLAPLLNQCGIKPEATEVVFFGLDSKDETLRKGTKRELTIPVPFGRSMSLNDALKDNRLLAYHRDGKPLEKRNGAPLRLIVPGWYGIANVKWLTRIEVRDRRYMGRFMGRDYVTVRGERRDGKVVFVESSVTKMNVKSMIARVMRLPAKDGRVPLKAYGAAWDDGTDITKVDVRLDDGPWLPAKLADEPRSKYCWRFFSIDLGTVAPGKHTVVSRATDANGRVQPAADDDAIALKRTYWEANQQWVREIDVQV